MSPPRATATELQGETLQPDLIFKEAYAVKCCLPGQHPEEDDTLVSGGLRKGIGWRRGLIVSLEETVFVLVSDVDTDALGVILAQDQKASHNMSK